MECPLFLHSEDLIKNFENFPIQESEIYKSFYHLKKSKNNNIVDNNNNDDNDDGNNDINFIDNNDNESLSSHLNNKTYNILDNFNKQTQYNFGDNREIKLMAGYHKYFKTTCLYYDLTHKYNYHLVIIFTPDYFISNEFYMQIYCLSNADNSLTLKSIINKCEYPFEHNSIKFDCNEENSSYQHETYNLSDQERFIINTLVSDLKYYMLKCIPKSTSDLKKKINFQKNIDIEKLVINNIQNVNLTQFQINIVMSLLLKENNTKMILERKTIKENEYVSSDFNEDKLENSMNPKQKNSNDLISLLSRHSVLSDLNSGKSVIAAALVSCQPITMNNKSISEEEITYENFYEDVIPLKIVNSSLIVSSYSNIPKWEKLINSIYKHPCYFIKNKFDLRRLLNDCFDDYLGNNLSIDPNDKIKFSKEFKKTFIIKSGTIRLDILNTIPLFVVSENVYRNFYKFVEGIVFQRVIYDHPEQINGTHNIPYNTYELPQRWKLYKSYHNIYLTNLPYKYFNKLPMTNHSFLPIDNIFEIIIRKYQYEINNFNVYNYDYFKNRGSLLTHQFTQVESDKYILIQCILKFQEIMSLLMVKTDHEVLSSERPNNKIQTIKMFCGNDYNYENSSNYKIIPEEVIEKIRQDKINEAIRFNKFPVRSLEEFKIFFKEKEFDKKQTYLSEIEDRLDDTSEESNLCTICYDEIDYMLLPHCCYQKFCYKCMVLSMLGGISSNNDINASCPMCRYKFNSNDDITCIKNEKYNDATSSSISSKKVTMKISEIVKISVNNTKKKMMYYTCQHILEITENPKVIIVTDNTNSYREYDIKQIGLTDLFQKKDMRIENITYRRKHSKIRQILENFETEFCSCLILKYYDYQYLIGKNLSFITDIIFIEEDILNNKYMPFINTLQDSYTETEQRIWMLRKKERDNI